MNSPKIEQETPEPESWSETWTGNSPDPETSPAMRLWCRVPTPELTTQYAPQPWAGYLPPPPPPPIDHEPGPPTEHTHEPVNTNPWYDPEPQSTLEATPEIDMDDAEPAVESAPEEPEVVTFRGPATDSEYTKWTFPQPDAQVFTLDDQNLAASLPLDNGRHPNMTPPTASLGNLEHFPPEINSQVMSALNIGDITVFRRVNKKARQLVDSHIQYARLVRDCPDIVRAIIATQAQLSVRVVHDVLKEEKCSKCKGFGSFFHITSGTRVCVSCFRNVRSFNPVTESEMMQGILTRGWDDISHLPCIVSLPGTYGPSNQQVTWRERLWHLPDVQEAAPGMLMLGQFRPPNTMIARGRMFHYRRFMTVISAPVLSPRSAKPVDWGVFCRGCRSMDYPAISRYWGTKYTRQSFNQHVMRHGGLKYNGIRFEHTAAVRDVTPNTAHEQPERGSAEAGWQELTDKRLVQVPVSAVWIHPATRPAPGQAGPSNTHVAVPANNAVVKTALEFHLDGTISAAAFRVAQDFDAMKADDEGLDPFRTTPPVIEDSLSRALQFLAAQDNPGLPRFHLDSYGFQRPLAEPANAFTPGHPWSTVPRVAVSLSTPAPSAPEVRPPIDGLMDGGPRFVPGPPSPSFLASILTSIRATAPGPHGVLSTSIPAPAPGPHDVLSTSIPAPAPSPYGALSTSIPAPAPSPYGALSTSIPAPAPGPYDVLSTSIPAPAPSPHSALSTPILAPAPGPRARQRPSCAQLMAAVWE